MTSDDMKIIFLVIGWSLIFFASILAMNIAHVRIGNDTTDSVVNITWAMALLSGLMFYPMLKTVGNYIEKRKKEKKENASND